MASVPWAQQVTKQTDVHLRDSATVPPFSTKPGARRESKLPGRPLPSGVLSSHCGGRAGRQPAQSVREQGARWQQGTELIRQKLCWPKVTLQLGFPVETTTLWGGGGGRRQVCSHLPACLLTAAQLPSIVSHACTVCGPVVMSCLLIRALWNSGF